ncbi:MAG TPA: hypothetical protein VFZ35_00495 [Sphingomicrobium sp.]
MKIAGAVALSGIAAAGLAVPAFDAWSSPENLEAIAGTSGDINTPAVDGCGSISPDGSQIAFTSNRTGNFDVYISERLPSGGFGPPERLPSPINGPSTDSCPTLLEGHRMIFTSFRDDPAGDLYQTRLGPKGWSAPARFGPNINQPNTQEESADIYEDDEGREVMIFSRRPGANSTGKIYQSVDGGPATLVAGGPHSSAGDNRPSITKDGRTMYFDSTRSGGLGDTDFYVSRRSQASGPWGTAEHLASLSSPAFDGRPFISKDGSMLLFASGRSGTTGVAPDIFFSTRDRIRGKR